MQQLKVADLYSINLILFISNDEPYAGPVQWLIPIAINSWSIFYAQNLDHILNAIGVINIIAI